MTEIKRHSEQERLVVLTIDDVKNIREFYTHFQVPMSEELKKVLDHWENTPFDKITFDDQKRLRAFLAQSISSSEHALIKDQVFSGIVNLCGKAWYDEQFDLDLEEVLTNKDQSSDLGPAGGAGDGDAD